MDHVQGSEKATAYEDAPYRDFKRDVSRIISRDSRNLRLYAAFSAMQPMKCSRTSKFSSPGSGTWASTTTTGI